MKLTRVLLFALVLAPLSLVACGDDGSNAEAGAVDCDTEPVPKFSEMTAVWAKCTTCHASTLTDAARMAAPVGIDFDMYQTAKTHAATAKDEVEEGAMPPAGQTPLTADEEDQLIRWASCGTPE